MSLTPTLHEREHESILSQFEVRIGETVLKDEVADVVLQEFIFEHTMETRAAIILRLEKADPSRLDLHWPAIVDEVDATRKRLFYGVVVEAYCAEGNKLVLACEDAKRYCKRNSRRDLGFRSSQGRRSSSTLVKRRTFRVFPSRRVLAASGLSCPS
jgi:hypothetical protein